MFIAGNYVGIVSEISELNVCFDENLNDDDDDTPQEQANETYDLLSFLLSAIILSMIYRSPIRAQDSARGHAAELLGGCHC